MPYEKSIPIEVFAMSAMSDKTVLAIIDSWPIKLEVIHSTVVKHFHDLGVFFVQPFGHSEVVKKQLLIILRNSPILIEMIDKAKRAAAAAATRGRMNDE